MTTPTATTRVLVVDDHRAFADLLALVVESNPGLRCAGVATSLSSLAALLDATTVDVAVVDVWLGREDGLDAARMVRAACPAAAVVLLTGHPTPEVVEAGRRLGARAVVDKRAPWRVVLRRIIAAAGADADPATRRVGGDGFPGRTPPPPSPAASRWLGTLTAREHQVLVALTEGRAVKDVAADLGITVNTCRGYAQQVLEKLGAHSRLEAVAVARRAGLLD